MKRVLSIWLPNLAIERWVRTSDCPPDTPVVLTIDGPNGPVIHAVTREAASRGARPGARLTDARALDPRLVAIPADPDGDRALLERLARWAGRWSPLVEVDGVDSLRLDVTGVSHLFGGEDGLMADVTRRFARAGLTVRLGLAPTAAAAWALAFCRPGRCGQEDPSDLNPFPVAALRLEADIVRTLNRLGLKTIGDLLALPRLALARRFRGGQDVVERLDRLVARTPEPLTAIASPAQPRALLRMEEPAAHGEAALQALDHLVPRLAKALQQRRLGVRRLTLTGFRVDGSSGSVSAGTALASRDPGHLRRLLADALANGAGFDPGFGIDAFLLEADRTEPLGADQGSLVEEPDESRHIAVLVDRLTVRLGPRAVRWPISCDSHLPERSCRWVSGSALPTGRPARSKARPQRLLDRPEAIDVIYATPEGLPRRFVWRKMVHDIARAEGPERIAPEWWRQPSTARLRDYYRVEDGEGRRYWIFREGVAGDGRGGAPGWFLHGLFG